MQCSVKKNVLAALCALVTGCSNLPPIKTVDQVDLQRFMGDWYVIACIPTLIEKDVHNAIESYQLADNGTIKTTFSFRKGNANGELKQYHPTGFVLPNTGNALWGMQFIWPIKAEYRIVYLDEAYQNTIIARNARDYVWLMSRSPNMSNQAYQAYLAQIKGMGYDINKLVKIPQDWHSPINHTQLNKDVD